MTKNPYELRDSFIAHGYDVSARPGEFDDELLALYNTPQTRMASRDKDVVDNWLANNYGLKEKIVVLSLKPYPTTDPRYAVYITCNVILEFFRGKIPKMNPNNATNQQAIWVLKHFGEITADTEAAFWDFFKEEYTVAMDSYGEPLTLTDIRTVENLPKIEQLQSLIDTTAQLQATRAAFLADLMAGNDVDIQAVL
jgi:hypothetical protein